MSQKAHNLSASRVDLASLCAYWCRGDVAIPERPRGKKAIRGDIVHLAHHASHLGVQLPKLDKDSGRMWEQLKKWLASEPPYQFVELPLLYDTETDTADICELGPGGHRDYLGVTATKLPGTVDLLRVDGDTVVLPDVKTGAHGNCRLPHENDQLASLGLAAARHLRKAFARVGLIFTRLTKVRPPDWYTLDADALDVHAGRLHALLKTIPNAAPVRGSWCWKCPIGPEKGQRSTCPAWQEENDACSPSP